MNSIRVAAIAFAGVVFGALITGYFQWSSSKEQTDIRLVEVAVGVLRAKPNEEDLKALRNWAINVVENRSGTRFTQQEREALQKYALPYEPKYLPWSTEFSDKFAPLSGTDRYAPLPGTDRYAPPPGTDKNPNAPAVKREAEEDWGREKWR
jgi:hypothetical protein